MTQETTLIISTIGNNSQDGHYVIINNEKVSISRKQYFRLMLLSEDTQELKLEDAASFNMQMATGIPAF